MPSWVIVGASRGIGYGFLEQLSKDPNNVVVGLVRDKATTDKKVADAGLQNVTILQADMVDIKSLQAAREPAAKLTGGSLDNLIVNGAYLSGATIGRFFDDFEEDPEALQHDLRTSFETNVSGVIYTINAFLPLIKKAANPKVVAITSGAGDLDLITKYHIWETGAYAVSKAAVNAVIAKYDARYREDGILFLALNPGVVETGQDFPPGIEGMFVKFQNYVKDIGIDFKGPITVADSVQKMVKVIADSTPEKQGGAFISQNGNKIWL